MLEFSNQSQWAAGIYPGWDKDKNFQLTTVFKVGYTFDGDGKLSAMEEVPEIFGVDTHAGKPHESGLIKVNEIAPFKKGSEFYLYGTARPHQDNLTAMEVGAGILFTDGQQWKKILRIFGKRKWKKTMVNYTFDEPGHVEEIPLSYEYAFGGRHPDNEDDEWPANPIGIGYNSDARNLIHEELPRIELGPNFMQTPMQKPIPAGYGPLPIFWEPRMSEIGDPIEDLAEQGGCPYGDNAQDTQHNVAPHDQRFKKPFVGGEVLHLRALVEGVSHQKTVQIVLPKIKAQLYTIINNKAELLQPVCDTVVVNTDDNTLHMIYRAGVPWRITDRRKGWIVLKDLEQQEHLTETESGESRDAPRKAS